MPIIQGLNLLGDGEGPPLVGYFGDPWQQIYDGRAGDFAPPALGRSITKEENFRCSPAVIDFLNAFRTDVKQFAAGRNKEVKGSVELRLIRAQEPQGERKRYTETQIAHALELLDDALRDWGWADREDVVRLFLARQMIARRLGFSTLHQLFTGSYSSSRSQDDYETGEHFLLKPFVQTVMPLVAAKRTDDVDTVVERLRRDSPAFDVRGPNARRR